MDTLTCMRSLAALTVVAVLALTGCASTAAPSPTVTVTIPASPDGAERNEEDYLSSLRRMEPQAAELDRAQLIDVGDQACERIAVGMSAAGVVEWIEGAGMPASMARAITAAAAVSLC